MAATANTLPTGYVKAVVARSSGATQQRQSVSPGLQAVSVSVLVPAAMPLLSPSDFAFPVRETTFLSDTASILGNEGSDADGFDTILADSLAAFPGDVNGLDGLLQDLADAGFTPGAFESDNWQPIGSDLGAFTQAGQALFDGVAGATTPPTGDGTPPPNQPPPSGGGGGGGGGTGGGGGVGGTTTPPPVGTGQGGTQCTFVLNLDGVTGTWVCTEAPPQPGGIHPPLLP